MSASSGGFTLIELVIGLLILAVFVDLARSSAAPVFDRVSVHAATTTLANLHGRARARAVERGRTVQLRLDPVGDSIWIVDGSDVVETFRFANDTGVDLVAPSLVHLCMSPRGYADTDCNSFSTSVEVSFARGGADATVLLRPLGQLVLQ